MRKWIAGVVAVWMSAGLASAEVTLPSVFGSNMVLQRDRTVPVWGSADAGERVTVSVAGQTKTTVADAQGKWKVALDPMPASAQPIVVTIAGSNTIELNNVLVGDVWICSGQSNMEWPVTRSRDPEPVAAGADQPMIRLFNASAKKKASPEPQSDLVAEWQVCSPETVRSFSAVGYHFARAVREKVNVPIGLVNVSWGGMPAEALTPLAALQSNPDAEALLQRYALAVENWPTAKAEFDRKLVEWEEARKAAEAAGQRPPQRPGVPYGPESANAPAAVWNGLVNPVVPVAMKGVIWYQGESNAGRAEQYRSLMRGLIQGWRDVWQQGDFPFIQVQLTSFRAPATQPSQPSDWAELRESQALVCRDLPNVGMVCITDVGDQQDIHPKDKQTVGYRLAQVALRDVYGQDVLASGPVLSDVQFDGARAIVSFETFGSPLEVKGDTLRGFLIAGEDQQWHFATATLENGRVIVSHDAVSKPVAVRYNWADNPGGNLFNKAGWPAHPFATDNFPRNTAGKR